MEKDRSLNLLQNGLLPVVHGAYHEALKMAIEALQTNLCKDCIDRNLVLSTVKSGRIRVIDGDDWKRVMDNASEIRELPSVQPEQKMGKWIKKIVRGRVELYCSNCGDGIDVIYEYNYCPNCGSYNGGTVKNVNE